MQQQIPFEDDKQEKQGQQQIPCGNGKKKSKCKRGFPSGMTTKREGEGGSTPPERSSLDSSAGLRRSLSLVLHFAGGVAFSVVSG